MIIKLKFDLDSYGNIKPSKNIEGICSQIYGKKERHIRMSSSDFVITDMLSIKIMKLICFTQKLFLTHAYVSAVHLTSAKLVFMHSFLSYRNESTTL